MSRLTQKGQGAPLPIFGSSTDASLETLTGARFDSADGREFVLAKIGGSNIGAALLVQGVAAVANNVNLAVVADAAIGATQITVTLGGTAVTANQYAGGYAIVNAGTGIGQTLKIASHPAQSNASGNVVITLEDPLQVAIALSDSKVSLLTNPYSGVIVCPAATVTATPVGVTLYPVTASTYALLTTKGVNALYSSSAIALAGHRVGIGATAGWGAVATAAEGTFGVAYQAAVSAEARAVFIDL